MTLIKKIYQVVMVENCQKHIDCYKNVEKKLEDIIKIE